MRPMQTFMPGSRIISGPQNGQPEYHPLEVARGPEGALWSAWKPSIWEKVKILCGSPVMVAVLAQRQPPIMVTTDPPKPAPDGEGRKI